MYRPAAYEPQLRVFEAEAMEACCPPITGRSGAVSEREPEWHAAGTGRVHGVSDAQAHLNPACVIATLLRHDAAPLLRKYLLQRWCFEPTACCRGVDPLASRLKPFAGGVGRRRSWNIPRRWCSCSSRKHRSRDAGRVPDGAVKRAVKRAVVCAPAGIRNCVSCYTQRIVPTRPSEGVGRRPPPHARRAGGAPAAQRLLNLQARHLVAHRVR